MKFTKAFAGSTLVAVLFLTGCSATNTPVSPEEPVVSTTVASEAPASTQPEPSASEAPAPVETAPEASAGTALAVLQTLEVKPLDTASQYDRDLFGEPWEDIEGNGCDTRNDILLRDLNNVTIDSDECTVLLGTFVDPYSSQTVNFDRSTGNGGGIDIDHVIALSAGFKTGGATWSEEKRVQFANDPLNLLASASGPNRAKGDKDASEWLPSDAGNPAFNCTYVARQIAVKDKYEAWVTEAEKNTMATVLSDCPNEPIPTDASVPEVDAGPAPVQEAPAEQAPAPAPDAGTGGTDPDYGSCSKAKAAGAGPYVQGTDPEYDFYRDGDGDGTVCE